MKRKRHTPEEIVLRLREVERAEAEGQSVAQVCKTLGVSEQTLHRWRKQYGGMAQPEVKRLRELERDLSVAGDERDLNPQGSSVRGRASL